MPEPRKHPDHHTTDGPSTANQVPPPGNDPDVNNPHFRHPSVDSPEVNFVTPADAREPLPPSNVDDTVEVEEVEVVDERDTDDTEPTLNPVA